MKLSSAGQAYFDELYCEKNIEVAGEEEDFSAAQDDDCDIDSD